MQIEDKDPEYIASVLKSLRIKLGLTQENLADLANVSTRTIEKSESGKHVPSDFTLRSLSRALGTDFEIFYKPSPEDIETASQIIDDLGKRYSSVDLHEISSASDFINYFSSWDGWRFNLPETIDAEVLDISGAIGDWIDDLGTIWSEAIPSQRINYATEFLELCNSLNKLGFGCFIGSHFESSRIKSIESKLHLGVIFIAKREVEKETITILVSKEV